MNVIKGLIGAGLGAIAGAAVWALLVYFTNYEFGFVAWALGVAAGFGMMMGSGGKGGIGMGVAAAVVAVLGILAGKLMVAHVIATEHVARSIDNIGEVEAVAALRDDVMTQWLSEQRTMTWPRGMTPEAALEEGYVPPEVEKEASNRWRRMDASDRQDHINGLRVAAGQSATERTLLTTVVAFVLSFGLFDLLWCALALGSAYKLGSRVPSADPVATAQPAPAAGRPAAQPSPQAPIAPPAEGAVPPAPPQAAPKPARPVKPASAERGAPPGAIADDEASRSFFRGAAISDDFPDPAAKFIKKRAVSPDGAVEQPGTCIDREAA
ncbi:MAG: hypothetical protein K2W85_02045 [Phycisphaerales bacterium]|nr:hypothetical protein [Phycisphaerales bacterium]